MNFNQRLTKLEEKASKIYLDPNADVELTEWLKSHPEYSPFAQPDSSDEIVMPEHLTRALTRRIDVLCKERNLLPNLSSLVKLCRESPGILNL
jgi:hypothetical protein